MLQSREGQSLLFSASLNRGSLEWYDHNPGEESSEKAMDGLHVLFHLPNMKTAA